MNMQNRVNTDSLNLTRDEAVELMIHHLRLAALFYEATPDDNGHQIEEELYRVTKDPQTGSHAIWLSAALAFANTIHAEYDSLKKDD